MADNNYFTHTLLVHNGHTRTVKEWSKELGISVETIIQRLKNGKCIPDALATVKPRKAYACNR
jgi:hypothetical protein